LAVGLTIGLALGHAANVSAQNFLQAAADVPLMPGLAEIDGAATVFDKPDGRIIETLAEGALRLTEVEKFYAQTLPALGWQSRGQGLYERDGERLTLGLGGRDGAVTVRFLIAPM
jgi:hypothetical protein